MLQLSTLICLFLYQLMEVDRPQKPLPRLVLPEPVGQRQLWHREREQAHEDGPQSKPEKRVQAKSLMYGEKGKHYPGRKDEARSANLGTQKRTGAPEPIITGNHN